MRAFILNTSKKDGTNKKSYVLNNEKSALEMEGHFSEVETLEVTSPVEINVEGDVLQKLNDLVGVLSMNEGTKEKCIEEGEIKYL